ncbi:hypothetical protein BT69DRAFT_1283423 [Atractiella rhizophila]|nr:hypothetical protein BT69DRAFT_1283423 [Atractiella rhizophila]
MTEALVTLECLAGARKAVPTSSRSNVPVGSSKVSVTKTEVVSKQGSTNDVDENAEADKKSSVRVDLVGIFPMDLKEEMDMERNMDGLVARTKTPSMCFW